MQKTFLTKEKLAEFKKELIDLKTRARREIAERLKQAKELGDLSENSEFASAREEQHLLESRIGQLEDLVRNASVIRKPQNSQAVKIGSTFKVQKNSQVFTFTIVGSEDARPGKGLISNESPLGRAFLGKKIGEVVRVETPIGHTQYKIIGIE